MCTSLFPFAFCGPERVFLGTLILICAQRGCRRRYCTGSLFLKWRHRGADSEGVTQVVSEGGRYGRSKERNSIAGGLCHRNPDVHRNQEQQETEGMISFVKIEKML